LVDRSLRQVQQPLGLHRIDVHHDRNRAGPRLITFVADSSVATNP